MILHFTLLLPLSLWPLSFIFRYPQCLHYLELLQSEQFRWELANTQCSKFIEEQQLLHWHLYTTKRMQFQHQICGWRKVVCVCVYVWCVCVYVWCMCVCGACVCVCMWAVSMILLKSGELHSLKPYQLLDCIVRVAYNILVCKTKRQGHACCIMREKSMGGWVLRHAGTYHSFSLSLSPSSQPSLPETATKSEVGIE